MTFEDEQPRDAEELCSVCGQPLVGDPDDQPSGPGWGAVCGACYRSRQFDQLQWEMGERA